MEIECKPTPEQIATRTRSEMLYLTEMFNREYKRIKDSYFEEGVSIIISPDGYLGCHIIV